MAILPQPHKQRARTKKERARATNLVYVHGDGVSDLQCSIHGAQHAGHSLSLTCVFFTVNSILWKHTLQALVSTSLICFAR